MIIDKLENLPKYVNDRDILQIVKEYINKEKGEYTINEKTILKRVYSTTKLSDVAKIESHKFHTDIQIPLTGNELYYIYDRENVSEYTEYDVEKDVVFYKKIGKKKCSVWVNIGEFILLNSNEIHQPQIALRNIATIEKIVLKVDERI
ncbi:YhcH/YjgK/YiaL family protein [Methanomethylophilus alvi]|uniref:YhcH/YjgK/YiaL family protein n=1 Tax=Methanomethylophilus alvi TaxID=1291540 RepID=UPI0037DD18ED